MTIPSIRDSASHVSVANETFRAVMPADVQEGDLLVVHYAGDGNLSTLLAQSGDFQGWSLFHSQVVSGTLVEGSLIKWADGNEGGQTFLAGTSPSEKWCVSTFALIDVEPYLANGAFRNTGTNNSNPNQGAVSLSTAADHLVLTGLAGEGATATTGIPAGYTGLHNLNNGAADGVSLRTAYKEVAMGPTSEDPGAWTRASTAWAALISGYRGVDLLTAPKHQRIIGRKTEVLSGGTKDYSVTVRAGEARRFFCALHVASSTVSAITLDPGGGNETHLTRVQTASGTFAESAAIGSARAVTWYEVWPVPPAGTYTLRVTTSVTTDVALLSQTMLFCEQQPVAYGVLNDADSGAASTGNIDIPDFGMVLTAAVQPLSLHPSASDFIWQSRGGMNQQSSWTPPHYCTVLARRVSGGGTVTQTVEAGNAVQAFSAFSVRYARDHVDPLFFGGF